MLYSGVDPILHIMALVKRLRNLLVRRACQMPAYQQQAAFAVQSAEALTKMMETTDITQWRSLERQIKFSEEQADALLIDFYDQIYERSFAPAKRIDMQNIATGMDDFIDAINSSAKSILLYLPTRIDTHLLDLAQYIQAGAETLAKIMVLIKDVKGNHLSILKLCDRIKELEHAGDEAYEDYISIIFTNEKDAIELMKYKNIAELLESTTDIAKGVSDDIRQVVLRYI